MAEGVGSEPFLPSFDQGHKVGFAPLQFKSRNSAKELVGSTFALRRDTRAVCSKGVYQP